MTSDWPTLFRYTQCTAWQNKYDASSKWNRAHTIKRHVMSHQRLCQTQYPSMQSYNAGLLLQSSSASPMSSLYLPLPAVRFFLHGSASIFIILIIVACSILVWSNARISIDGAWVLIPFTMVTMLGQFSSVHIGLVHLHRWHTKHRCLAIGCNRL